MNDDTTAPATQNPERQPAKSRLRSAILRADVIRVAEQVAQTQDRLAESLRRMASQHPLEASRLRASISAAENHAVWTRHLAHHLRVGRPQGDDIRGNRPDIPAAAVAPVSHTGSNYFGQPVGTRDPDSNDVFTRYDNDGRAESVTEPV